MSAVDTIISGSARRDPSNASLVDALESRRYIDLVADRYGLTPDEAATLDSVWREARFGAPDSPNRP